MLENANFSFKDSIHQLYNQFVEESLIEFEIVNLEANSVEFLMLKKEYNEGLMLFQLMEEFVWEKASLDSAGLRAFYEENKSIYKTETSLKGVIITLKNLGLEDSLESFINQAKTDFSNDSTYHHVC